MIEFGGSIVEVWHVIGSSNSESARFDPNERKLVKMLSATNEAKIDSLRLQKGINSVAVLLQAVNIIFVPPCFSMKAWYESAVQRVRPHHVRLIVCDIAYSNTFRCHVMSEVTKAVILLGGPQKGMLFVTNEMCSINLLLRRLGKYSTQNVR